MTTTPTATLANVAKRIWDVVVVGAGPAGSIAARSLALLGKSVLLVDKAHFPRNKVCGGCLNPAAIATLTRLGLDDVPRRSQGVALSSFKLSCGQSHSKLPLAGGYAIARDAFDFELWQAAVAGGAATLSGVAARSAGSTPEDRFVELIAEKEKATVTAKIVIVATGLAGWPGDAGLGRRVPRGDALIGAGAMLRAAGTSLQPGTLYMAVGAGGYVGMVRLDDGRVDVAAAFERSFLAQCDGPAAAAKHIHEQAGQAELPELAAAVWSGTPAMSHRVSRVADHRLFVIGDAAAYEEPFTGEGMAWAMQSACELSPLAAAAVNDYSPLLPARWEALHRRLLGRRMLICRAVGQVLRRPQMMRAVSMALARAPWLARPLIHSIHNPARVA